MPPIPYPFPAITIKGVLDSTYFCEASQMYILLPEGKYVVQPPFVPGAISFLSLIFANVPLTISSGLPLLEPKELKDFLSTPFSER